MTVKLIKADKSHEKVLCNLQQLYLHDLSKYNTIEMNEECRFINDDIKSYLDKEELLPFLIQLDQQVIGFLLLNQSPYTPKAHDYFINDFFILNAFRRRGYGKAVVDLVLDEYEGTFGLLELKTNLLAIKFWQHYLKDEVYEEIEMIVDEEPCFFHSFLNKKDQH